VWRGFLRGGDAFDLGLFLRQLRYYAKIRELKVREGIRLETDKERSRWDDGEASRDQMTVY